ncbi:MAG: phosphate/phosphite/phosphonate ABC transporter substrate-binding protein [Planctomycetes bacterium]|nr:phosphate/phosphite/phosphonate ABC transporter substrate-binding protein [Planctomycetota bacterium]
MKLLSRSLLLSLVVAASVVAIGCSPPAPNTPDQKGGGGGDSTAKDSAKPDDKNKPASWPRDGSKEKPLLVMLVPADGGTEDGTKKDFVPIFNAISKTKSLTFDIKVGQSYSAVIEAMANGQVDIAFFGAVSYLQCKKKGGAELLAVEVHKGSSIYYSGIFTRADTGIEKIEDLKGKSVAFGDPSSTSSFNYPAAMLLDAKIDPVKDLGKIVMAGSHVNSLMACAEGKVDACCASFDSLEKAVTDKKIEAGKLKAIKKSDPIPAPPIAMNPGLPADLKQKLRDGFATVHKAEGVTPDMVRGYGGKKVDRYDTEYKESEFMKAAEKLEVVDKIKADILKKAGAQ